MSRTWGESLRKDNRGQAKFSARKGVMLVVALTVAALMAALVLSVGIDEMVTDQTTSITIEGNGTTENVDTHLNLTLESADGTNANFTVNDTDAGSTASTGDLTEGSNTTVTVDGGDVTVNATTVNDGNATADVSYAKDFAFSGAAQSLWGILDIIIVLAVFMFVMAVALKTM